MTDTHDARVEAAARVMYDEFNGLVADAWEREDSYEKSYWLAQARAVLAVIDVDAVRAEAQVEVLREAADDWHEEHVGTRPGLYKWLWDRADRIAREAGIETGETLADPDHPTGTELRTAHGNRFVKVGDDYWQVRKGWGILDAWTRYTDGDVWGEVIGEGVTK